MSAQSLLGSVVTDSSSNPSDSTQQSTPPPAWGVVVAADSETISWTAFVLFGFISFTEGLGVGIYVPFLSPEVEEKFGIGTSASGLLFAFYGIGAMLSSIILAWYGHRVNPRFLLRMSTLFLFLSSTLFAVGWNSFALLLVARCIQGTTYSAVWAAIPTLISRIYPPLHVAFMHGNLVTLYAGGVMFGPFVGAFLFSFEELAPLYLMAIMALLGLFGMIVVSMPGGKKEAIVGPTLTGWKRFVDRNIFIGLMQMFMKNCAQMALDPVIPTYLQPEVSTQQLGVLLLVLGCFFAVGSKVAAQMLKKIGTEISLPLSMLLQAIGFGCIFIPFEVYHYNLGPLPLSPFWFWGLQGLVFAIFGFAVGFQQPQSSGLLADASKRQQIGLISLFSIRAGIGSTAYFVGPAMIGWISEARNFPIACLSFSALFFVAFTFSLMHNPLRLSEKPLQK